MTVSTRDASYWVMLSSSVCRPFINYVSVSSEGGGGWKKSLRTLTLGESLPRWSRDNVLASGSKVRGFKSG